MQDASPPPAAVGELIVKAATLGPSMSDAAFSVVQLPIGQVQENVRVDQALSQAPGVSLFRRTDSILENPTTQGISLRSIAPSGAGRALVTLDGVPQNDPFGGWVIWGSLPPDSIDGVSIVRGGGAGPYGAGALTGVVALTERSHDGIVADVSHGSYNTSQGQLVAEHQFADGDYMISGSTGHSDGFIPVVAGRGAIDTPLWMNQFSTAFRANYTIADAVLSVHVGAYQEDRGSGQVGANAKAKGDDGSFTLARAPTDTTVGWRLQGWVRTSNLYNSSVSVAAGRATDTVSNIEYDTPATGYGLNSALRGANAMGEWEVGADLRSYSGEDHELFSTNLSSNREAGGNQMGAGVYAEGARTTGPWLLTGGLRLDYWQDTNGHLVEKVIATNVVTKNVVSPKASGVVPTGRFGLRREYSDGYYVRAAAYAGFRQPSLNELYRPFRVGNITTNANADLNPEKLYGVEGSFGRKVSNTDFSVTAFYNRINDAVANVTLSPTVRQRQNIDAITAPGVEAEASTHWTDSVTTHLGVSYTAAKVDGGTANPTLTGLHPAQAPRSTVTGSIDWKATSKLTVAAEGRYETLRFDDDQNLNRLPGGGTIDLRVSYDVSKNAQLYATVGNASNTALATAVAADGTISYDTPRTVSVGLTIRR